jgi:hypothetical protein
MEDGPSRAIFLGAAVPPRQHFGCVNDAAAIACSMMITILRFLQQSDN